MRIVIDMQGAQTESRFRGIGRYTLSLVKALVRNRGEHEIILALNGLFPDTIEPIRAEFYDLLPQENIRTWHAPGPVRESEPGNEWRRKAAELIRESFITGLQPDIVHITSLFEGYVDDAVTSIGLFNSTIPVSVSLYDLIPLLNPEQYLKPNPLHEQYYLRKIDHLRRSSLLLGISDSACREAEAQLGISNGHVINISTAIEPHFQPLVISESNAKELLTKFGIERPYLLYAGGADARKNLPRLIQAYANLPADLRDDHQMVFAGKMPAGDVIELQRIAIDAGLSKRDLIFTGYVTDEELVQLCNLGKLFVFPSWHEGFGLPALEAMACGLPVIAANTSSLPEVVGIDAALFDPFDATAISEKMIQALTDESFRNQMHEHGLQQAKKFSWDKSAKRAIAAFERFHSERSIMANCPPLRRPRLAYISPLPPERSGISDYSAELLPDLSRHYDIEVIVAQDEVSTPWINANTPIRSIDWFRQNAHHYDRILYHFGNSPFHQHMFALLTEFPGVVVLHDFFLSEVVAHMEVNGIEPSRWVEELYRGHGYQALQARFTARDTADVVWKYPCSFGVAAAAKGVICHSDNSLRLANKWYPSLGSDHFSVIPLLRVPVTGRRTQADARTDLGFSDNDFIICSFGLLDPTKLNQRLLDAWLSSELARDKRCHLVFVGENHRGDYGQKLLDTIRHSGVKKRIHITGWADNATFRNYLVAADMGVQLRTLSRGETSAAVLDCMNNALPTIVNANGSMADLPDDAVWKLPDEFSDIQLVEGLETLWRDNSKRKILGDRAKEVVQTRHAPALCAEMYQNSIERFYRSNSANVSALISRLSEIGEGKGSATEYLAWARAVAKNHPTKRPARQLLVDVTAIVQNDLHTGVERVGRAVLLELIGRDLIGYRVEPVYLSDAGGEWHYRYARTFTAGLLDYPSNLLVDEPVEAVAGDTLLGLDLVGGLIAETQPYLDQLYREGMGIEFVVYDLLPVLQPEVFPPGADETHKLWLNTIARYDGAICISRAVADELVNWVEGHGPERLWPFDISWFHLGADLARSSPTEGMPKGTSTLLKKIETSPSFLMVGTVEPRKGHLQTLAAFEQFWANDTDINLVIVGKEGWQGLPDDIRRTIPGIVSLIKLHPELNKRLFWLEGVSDEYLEKIYAASTCLIAASEGEGFGLPLIEAAHHKLPIIARDIPVFREVAGEHAFYFENRIDPETLRKTISEWLSLYQANKHPTSISMPWLTWRESTQQLLSNLKISIKKGE